MNSEVKHYKVLSMPSVGEPNTVYYVLDTQSVPGQFKVKTYITDINGIPIPLIDLSGISGLTAVENDDGTITVTTVAGVANIKISNSVMALVNSALQSGDPVSSLINDAGYITIADVPVFDPLDYDLTDFNNSDSNPFVREDSLAEVATTGDYNDLINIPTEFTPSAHLHIISDVTGLVTVLNSKADKTTTVNGQALSSNVLLNTDDIQESGTPTNKWWTNTRTIGAVLTGYFPGAGTISGADTILSAIEKLDGNITSLTTGVSSVFGRVGAVIAQSGDYNTSQVTENTNLYFTNGRVNTQLDTYSGDVTFLSGVSTIGALKVTNSMLFGNIAYSKLSLTNSIVNGDIVSVDWSKITLTPTTIAGYGITDFNSLGDARWSLLGHTHTFASLTSKPTTLLGYGITDAQPLDSNLTSWAAITRASGFDTFVATPNSANLAALLTDEKTAFNKDFGTGNSNIPEIGTTLTASKILATDASSKLQPLDTATYPSLTELSYIKGLTLAAQTQFANFAFTIPSGYTRNLVSYLTGVASTTFSSTTANSDNTTRYLYFHTSEDIVIDEAYIFVAAANAGASNYARLVVFDASNGGLPGTIISQQDSGVGSLTTANSVVTFATNISLTKGKYWFAVQLKSLDTAGVNPTFYFSTAPVHSIQVGTPTFANNHVTFMTSTITTLVNNPTVVLTGVSTTPLFPLIKIKIA